LSNTNRGKISYYKFVVVSEVRGRKIMNMI